MAFAAAKKASGVFPELGALIELQEFVNLKKKKEKGQLVIWCLPNHSKSTVRYLLAKEPDSCRNN